MYVVETLIALGQGNNKNDNWPTGGGQKGLAHKGQAQEGSAHKAQTMRAQPRRAQRTRARGPTRAYIVFSAATICLACCKQRHN